MMKLSIILTILLAFFGFSAHTQNQSVPVIKYADTPRSGMDILNPYANSILSGGCVSCPNYDFAYSMYSAWQTHASGIDAYACNMYRFPVISGNTYTFKTGCGDGATANFNTYLELFNSSCGLIAFDDDACENNRSSISWTAGYSGYVYLKVSGIGISAGKYTLAFRYEGYIGTCLTCPNYDFHFTPSVSWQTHASGIAPNGCKMYRFAVTSGNTYTFKTGCGDGATANFDTYLELYNSSCSALASNDDGCENYRSSITWTANYSGYVYLKVRGYDTSAGTYTLGYRYAGSSGSCVSCPNYDFHFTPNTFWETHTSGIVPIGCKMYRFYVTSGNTYTFKTGCGDGASANFDTFLELLNSNCSPLANNDDGCEVYRSSITWTANYSGYVYLKVRGYGTSAGTFTLAYRYDGLSASCLSCPNYDFSYSINSFWETHASTIEANGCKMYRFPVISGNTYTFKTGCGDGATASFDTYLELYNSSCSASAIDNDACENNRSSITWTAGYSGYVYLKVRGYGSSAGKFTLAYRNVDSYGICLNCPDFDFSYTPTTNYQIHTSGIAANGCKIYRFAVTTGNTYTFKTGCGDGATANFDTYLELMNSSCSVLATDDDSCENFRSSITWTAGYSGYVYLKVRGYYTSAGTFNLAFRYAGSGGNCVSCPYFDYNYTPGTTWQIHSSGITANGCKMYRFPVTTGNTYTFKTGCGDGATANFNTFLELFNSNCSALAIDDDGCENYRSSISWTADYSGHVYLKLSGYGASAGTYNLAYRYVGSCGTCVSCPNYDYNGTPTDNWQTHYAGILPDGCKMYRFGVIAGNTYTFKTGCGDGASADFNTLLELYNSNCTAIAIDDDGCENFRSSITWIAGYSGYVYLKVRGYGSSAGTYNLSYKTVTACGTCVGCPNYDFNYTPGTNWQTHSSGILPDGCKMYRFFVISGNNYTFKTGCGDGASASFNTYLELFNNNCFSLAVDDDGCENNRSSINWTASYTGYAYLKVRGYGSSAGTYALAFRYTAPYSSCVSCPDYDFSYTPGAYWETHSSGISPNGCKMYRFWVTDGNAYTFKTGCGDGATANFDTYLQLFNNSCTPLLNNDDGCENYRSSISWTANYTGYVYLKVRGWGTSAGNYTLAFKYSGPGGSCASCPNYNFNFTPAGTWQAHCASIVPYGCNMYRFWVTSGNTYTFKTGCGDGATANFNTYLELFNSNCSAIAIDDNGCENLRSSITWAASYSGYVYLKVSGIGSSAGTYNLSYRYEAGCSSCVSCPNYDFNLTPSTAWGLHCSSILPNGCKMYRFWVTSGNTYTFKTGCGDGATANFDTYLELLNSNCSLLVNNDDGCENYRSSIIWPANYTGYVYLKVRGWSSSWGTFNLAFRSNGVCGSIPVTGDKSELAGNPETVCSISSAGCGNGDPGCRSENMMSGTTDLDAGSGITVYPNPGNGKFTLAGLHRDPVKCQLSIYNAIGQCVYTDPDFMLNASAAIDISTQVNGVYHVFVRIGDELFRQKLIIQR